MDRVSLGVGTVLCLLIGASAVSGRQAGSAPCWIGVVFPACNKVYTQPGFGYNCTVIGVNGNCNATYPNLEGLDDTVHFQTVCTFGWGELNSYGVCEEEESFVRMVDCRAPTGDPCGGGGGYQ